MVVPTDLARDQADVTANAQAESVSARNRKLGAASDFLTCVAPSIKPGTPPAIVLGGNVNGLGALRSLAHHGIQSIVVTNSKVDPILRSKYPIERHVIDPITDLALLSLLDRYRDRHPVVIATSDYFASFLTTYENRLKESIHVFMPSNKLVQLLNDKRSETYAMQRAKVTIPKTIGELPSNAAQLIALMGVPLIIKPRSDPDKTIINAKNCIISSADDLEWFYERYGNHLDQFVVQEIIPGDDESLWLCLCVFDHNSCLVQAFTFYRLGCSPAHYGVTSFAVSKTNKIIAEQAAVIGRALKYRGVASIEFKFDERDRTYKYLETNPRLGMCNWFAACCGVNNAAASYQLALNGGSDREGDIGLDHCEQKNGVVFIDLYQDLSARMREGENWSSIFLRYIKYLGRPRVGAYWYWRDPLPACYLLSRGFLRRMAAPRWGRGPPVGVA